MNDKNYPIPSEKRTDQARKLRKDSTFPERMLWGILRNRRLSGIKFRRQFPIGSFVVDFCCVESQLIVELDGMTHAGQGEKDDARTDFLERMGYRVVRVTNDDVLQNIEAVAEMIERAVEENEPPGQPEIPSPRASPRGRGGKR